MSPIELFITIRHTIDMVLAVVFAGMAVFAVVEAARATGYAYESAFKRTKNFWLAVTGVSALALLFNLYAVLVLNTLSSIMIVLIAATAVGVFLADVRPVVSVRRR